VTEVLKANDFLAGISIDGPQEIADAYRGDKGGKPTFDRVIRGPDALNHHRFDQLCDVLRARAQGRYSVPIRAAFEAFAVPAGVRS